MACLHTSLTSLSSHFLSISSCSIKIEAGSYFYKKKKTCNIWTFQAPIVQGILVSHCEEDLLCIRAAFLKLTGTSLYTALQVSHTCNTHPWNTNQTLTGLHIIIFENILTRRAISETDSHVNRCISFSNRASSKEITYKLCWPSVVLKTNKDVWLQKLLFIMCFYFPVKSNCGAKLNFSFYHYLYLTLFALSVCYVDLYNQMRWWKFYCLHFRLSVSLLWLLLQNFLLTLMLSYQTVALL